MYHKHTAPLHTLTPSPTLHMCVLTPVVANQGRTSTAAAMVPLQAADTLGADVYNKHTAPQNNCPPHPHYKRVLTHKCEKTDA